MPARKPIPLKLAKGTLRASRSRGKIEADLAGAGSPPASLSQPEQALWLELTSLCRPGHLAASDRFMLELAVRLMAALRQDPAGFNAARVSQLRSVLSALGLAPLPRQQLIGPTMPPLPSAEQDVEDRYFAPPPGV